MSTLIALFCLGHVQILGAKYGSRLLINPMTPELKELKTRYTIYVALMLLKFMIDRYLILYFLISLGSRPLKMKPPMIRLKRTTNYFTRTLKLNLGAPITAANSYHAEIYKYLAPMSAIIVRPSAVATSC